MIQAIPRQSAKGASLSSARGLRADLTESPPSDFLACFCKGWYVPCITDVGIPACLQLKLAP